MDQTRLSFEFLDSQTYNQIGEKTIWVQSSKSGWDKRQGTIQLTVFADGVPRVKPLISFWVQGTGPTIVSERRQYDNRVIVNLKFNPTAYANSSNVLEWLEEQLIPVLNGQPTLLAIDLFSGHRIEEVVDTFRAHDITPSIIPRGCTGLVQPLDVSINRPFKNLLRVSTQYKEIGMGNLSNLKTLICRMRWKTDLAKSRKRKRGYSGKGEDLPEV